MMFASSHLGCPHYENLSMFAGSAVTELDEKAQQDTCLWPVGSV